jgi:tetratricopeptide (TPR) repeat protein
MSILITGDACFTSARKICLTLLLACGGASVSHAQTPATLFEQALSAEQRLELSTAQDKLQEAVRREPTMPGLREHTAWQNYLTGFHDRETLELFESALPDAKDPDAVRTAIRHVRGVLGMEDGAPPPPAARPAAAPSADNLPGRLQYARELYWSGSPAEAQAVLDELIARQPDEAVLRLEKARVLAALNDHTAAAAEADTARRSRPGDRRLQAALDRVTAQGPREVTSTAPARVAAPRRSPSTARSAASPSGTTLRGGSRTASLFRQGQQAEARLDLFGAREIYREALATNPSYPGLREHTAWFLFLNEFHDPECLTLFEASLPTASDKTATRQAISLLRQKLGLAPATPQTPAVAPRRAPSSSNEAARLAYARQLFWSGSPQEAQSVLEELVARHPAEPSLRLALGNVLMAQNDYPAAARELKTAQQLRPQEPEIALALSHAEAMRGRRTASIRALRGVGFSDEGTMHLARAQAYHYAAEFFPASHAYRQALAARPYDEVAAHGLAETSLRNGSVPEARELLAAWPGIALQTDWGDRLSLENEVAAPRLRAGSSYFGNSLNYYNWNVGGDVRFRPLDEVELGFLGTYGNFQQTGFSRISRVTGTFSAIWQPGDLWALSGRVGVNGYTTGWTSVTGGVGLMARPFSNLQIEVTADHLDVVDSEPALGVSLYDLAATIGAVGGRATMDVLGFSATWTPVERLKLFGKYRLGTLTGDSTMNDYYVEASYLVWRPADLRFGYGLSQTMFSAAAPIYREGNNTTSYYYDPKNLIVQNFYGEFAVPVTKNVTVGGEGHFYQQPVNGGVGTGLFGFVRFNWSDNQALRLDARWFSQDRGLNRDGTSSNYYNALNLVAVYEIRF